MSKRPLRKQLRELRRNLSRERQRRAAKAVVTQLRPLKIFRQAKHIAVYLDNDGELGTKYLIDYARRCEKGVYLPVISGKQLNFRAYPKHARFSRNCYGIAEPQPRYAVREAMALDIVFLPLVGFARDGSRLGMGGGFYDRTFAQKRKTTQTRPLLVGLAHHFQEQNSLPCEPWDISLDYVVTDRELIHCDRR